MSTAPTKSETTETTTTTTKTNVPAGEAAAPREQMHIRAMKSTGQILQGLTLKVILVSNLLTYGAYCTLRDGVPWLTGQTRAAANSADQMHDAILGGTGNIAPMNVRNFQVPP